MSVDFRTGTSNDLNVTTPMSHVRPLLRCSSIWRATGWSGALWVSGALMLATGVPLPHTTAPTYTDDVAKILYRNCVRCHQQDRSAARIPLDLPMKL